jgi:hypothetical protein
MLAAMMMMMMMMLFVRTQNLEFLTWTVAFYMVTKEGAMNFGTGALCVQVGPTLHAATATQCL